MAWHTQNFLKLQLQLQHRPSALRDILRIADIRPDDLVLDLGAGHGELTEHLAPRCRRVIAIEFDPLLAKRLQLRFAEQRNVSVRVDDVLVSRLPREPYKVVANIPFDITSRLIRRLTSATYAPMDAYLVVQREAAERVLGWPRETLFGMLIKPWFEPSIAYRFRRTDFQPAPRVDVVFLRLCKRGPPLVPAEDAEGYRALVTLAFCAAKPTVQTALAPVIGHRRFLKLSRELRLDPLVAPSGVRLEAWVGLSRILRKDPDVMKEIDRLGSNVTTMRAMRRTAVLRITRPARRPPSRRQA